MPQGQTPGQRWAQSEIHDHVQIRPLPTALYNFFYHKNHQNPCTMQIHSPNTKFSNILQIRSARMSGMHAWSCDYPSIGNEFCTTLIATVQGRCTMHFMKPHKLDTVAVTDFNSIVDAIVGLIKISAECISCGCTCFEYTCP